MRTTPSIAIVSVLSLATVGCSDNPETIHVDTDHIESMRVNSADMLELEASDSSLLYDVGTLLPADSFIIVQSRNYIRKYDKTDGRFLGNIGAFGDDSTQYSIISNIWLDGDTVGVYDCNFNSIKYYSATNGKYLKSKALVVDSILPGQHPRQIVEAPGGSGSFYTFNMFTDYTTPHNPKLTLYDASGRRKGAVKGREVNEATYFSDGGFYDKSQNRVLVWEAFRDTVFSVDSLSISPLYAIDFGKASFPSQYQNMSGIPRKAQAFKNSKDTVASFVRYVQAQNGWLYFTFAFNDGRFNLVSYNEQNGKARAFHFASADNKLQQTSFFSLNGDSIYLEMRNKEQIEANPSIYKFAVKDIQ